ncbi:MAG: phospholipid/cholesterol/gamma-HCH transport system substrate-binding protein [Solirubrobacteraceae bacterium]|nr:phospholipid/cholesterol/gamma-HCH transport system substrate-binding protein [Solirubrobacteraceae bacterium]
MSTELTRGARLGLLVFAVVTVGLFGVLAARFGGPGIRLHQPARFHAFVADAQGLPQRADVLVRGVAVGHVSAIDGAGARARLELELGDGAPALRPDATVRVGAKTPLGESFVDLDPGARPGRFDARHALPARDAVQVDEALGVLGPRARSDLRGILATTGPALHAADISATVAELERATRELRTLGDTLRGQDTDVAQTVQASRDVLGELGAHTAAVRAIVADGETTLRAAGARPAALRDALGRLPAC